MNKLNKCFACFSGYGCKREKLPRKKKKMLKTVYFALKNVSYRSWMDDLCSCDLASYYKQYKGRINKWSYLQKYLAEIQFIAKFHDSEGIYIDDDGRLSWYWEYDSDYGGSSGLMPFEYSKEAAGDTWAFDEVKTLVEYLDYYDKEHEEDFEFPGSIKSDKDLLEYVRKNNFVNLIKLSTQKYFSV